MVFFNRSLLPLLALLVAAPSAHAAKCSDTSGFAAAQAAVEAACSCDALKHGQYVNCGKKAITSLLTGGCRKVFTQRYLAQSTCGRSGFEICCDTNKKGKDVSKAVKSGKCKGEVCTATAPQSVGEGCTSAGVCVTTTTTTTTSSSTTSTTLAGSRSTTTTSTTTTSTTTICVEDFCPTVLDFTLSMPGGTCGTTKDGANALLENLTCGGLNIGGGNSTVVEGPTPEGSISRFSLNCAGSSCTVFPNATVPPVNTPDPDCTDPGCAFGTPLPISNAGLSTCVLNTLTAPASGTLDLATGAASLGIVLKSETYVTGNVDQPCPRCSGSGTPSSPGTGTCDRGARVGQACTTTNPGGLTRDCPPGGADATRPCLPDGACTDGSLYVGPIAVDLSPLTTGSASKTDAAGLFCANVGQAALQVGCFGRPTCRSITETGAPAGAITPHVPAPVTLGTVFCIAATGSQAVNFSANLPGPGATSLPGRFLVN